MDPALLRERELFKKRALQVPVVEKRKFKDEQQSKDRKKAKVQAQPKAKPTTPFDYKTSQGSSQYKFSVLARIVKYMKDRHLKGQTHALTIEEILDETTQLDVNSRIQQWLATEALLNNPKIEVVNGNMFRYKPVLSLKNKHSLLRLLDKNYLHGRGGVLMDDVDESLPDSKKALKGLKDNITIICRPSDKKEVLFFNDKSCEFTVDEEIKKLWRSAAVEGMDENKKEKSTDKQGITSMQDIGLRKLQPAKKRNRGNNRRKNKTFKTHNDHLEGVLKDYSEDKK